MKPRITTLIGAGATFEIGAPKTEELTEIVTKKRIDSFESNSNLLLNISRILSEYYGFHPVNSTITHLLSCINFVYPIQIMTYVKFYKK